MKTERSLTGSAEAQSALRLFPSHVLFLTILALVSLTGLRGYAVSPRLGNITPPGGQRGTEVNVVFSGQRLDDAQEVIFYTSGLSVGKLEPGKDRVKATLTIAADCRLGEHQLRLRTAGGVSEVRTFWVGSMTNLSEVEPNNDVAKAQRVPLNSTVGGTIPSEDVDQFVVTVEKGQRLTAEIEGMRLGRGAFDPYIAILDQKGGLLAGCEDSPLGFQDGIVSLIVPETGDYMVQVRDSAYAGRDDYHYRLHVGTFPRPLAVYPVAAQAGSSVAAKFIGDVKGDFEQQLKMPSTPQDKFGAFAEGAPSPNWMRVTAFPTALEVEPNDTREQAGEARSAPVVFNGILAKPGDHDWFRFRAKKGEALQVSVYARRLRSPVDSSIQVVNAKGSVVGDNDDSAGPDSSLNFKPDEEGEYSVLVRDHLKRGGPGFVYCVEVAPVQPSLSVKIPEVARNDTQSRQYIAVPRGNRFASLISIKRTSAPGDLSFSMDGLPKGMRLLPTTMPGKVDQFPVVFEADADAPIAGALLDLVGSTTNGLHGRFQNDIELVQGPNNSSYYGTRVDKLMVAVTEAAPFKIHIAEPKVPLVQGGPMNLEVAVERESGFDEPINVRLVWRPPGVSALPDMTIAKGSNSVEYVLNAKADADLRDWPLVVLGSANVKGGELYVSSQVATLRVAEPYLTATMERSTCEPGQSTNIVVKLDQKIPFEGKATIKLIGLSEKVSVPEKEITKDDREVVFPVKVDASCGIGSQRNLFCTVTVPVNGVLIPHNVGQGGSFRVVPPKNPAAKKVASR
jgi:hypothetical protein